MNINFDYKLFNPNFYWVSECIRNEKYRHIFFYGGSSSGKTYSVVQNLVINVLMNGISVMVFRKIQNSIKKTVFRDFANVISTLHLEDMFEIQEFKIKCKVNKGEIHFSGVEEERIKGLSGYNIVFCDEITELDLSEFNQMRKRLRGVKNQKLIACYNPVSTTHWLYTEIHNKFDFTDIPNNFGDYRTMVERVQVYDNYMFIKSTYKNNYYIVGSPDGTWGYKDLHTISDFEHDRLHNFEFYKIYGLGEYGKIQHGSEFYKKFDRTKHTSDYLEFDSDMPLHLVFDENVNPYSILSIYQLDNNVLKNIDEIHLVNPDNNIHATLEEFYSRYKQYINSKIYIYGDATSRRKDARSEYGYNYYDLITKKLKELGFNDLTLRVPASNPSIILRGQFINKLLNNEIEGKSVLISSKCTKLLDDFYNINEDMDGKKQKLKFRDKEKGTTYERYGHFSDCFDYICCFVFSDEFNSFQNKNSQLFSTYIDYNENSFIF